MPRQRLHKPITLLCAAILERTGSAPHRGHRGIQQACADARLPGVIQINGRWFYYEDAVPEIVAALGMAEIAA